MKKKAFFTLLFSLFFIVLSAQEPQKKLFITSETGAAFTGTWDVWGLTIKNGLGYSLTKHLDITGYMEVQTFKDWNIKLYQRYLNFGSNLLYNFNVSKNLKLQIGAGGYLRQANYLYTYSELYLQNGDKIVNFSTKQVFAVGYYTTLGFEIPINEHVDFGLHLSLQNDTDVNITSGVKAGLRIAL